MENIAAAIYCRLSQDDGNAGESNSIQTQKALLKQYCAETESPLQVFIVMMGGAEQTSKDPSSNR